MPNQQKDDREPLGLIDYGCSIGLILYGIAILILTCVLVYIALGILLCD